MIDTAALLATLRRAPVVPVLIVEKLEHAVPLGTALVNGGLPALEVTLRTPVALDVVRAMADIPGGVVGAGTILDPAQAREAVAAGAKFLVSPGATPAILDAALELGVPLLPGVATASEAMAARERGFKVLKFFPAGPAGGPTYLKALASPLGDVVFCPTGGVSPENARDYLKLPNVVCVGGSWVAPADAVAAGDWARVEALAREAAAIRG
ncbi:bifunctional 4-hydroxy-2-oxoglutarate aldolase/2-dehydro-3-deoxy-phosphogluconate aldolase [Oharaeibacter diazotrophicus]|uniref:2-dehydro-3-deoxy-phosphogluconate aldolase n=1 Tax=Oharaeibacter diazotrophicus TaxID=1920512 RepID=A0A4R6RGG7_9HYPH|nr:bifunctional 4-hydroxy-2-oxoglutarate aldolase/2-dehydro-3-deoxy-phosphogluconate aldolase [Oharaeibacter diazotrophicus]TDP84887.1 2-keto-3-deoxy-phosphogluconate aldolase [Oharaeibacter diazotrophicus]BBE73858.1 KHG/KDPG aldolase [Pleomorphomonas sp. SM30]GLS76457.1 ketohydroxyglutarate aldolase [Oharaeibacter diazotrophicus]